MATNPVVSTPAPTSASNPPTKAYQFDEVAFKAQINKLEEMKLNKAGKANYNPFLWFGKVVAPLIARYTKGERSEDLFKSLLTIKEVDKLDPKIVDSTNSK